MLAEHQFYCPYCGETISMLLDLTISEQHYVEDCEVCCRPIEIRYRTSASVLEDFKADRGDD